MNLPNSLTVARIFLVPVLVSVLLTEFEDRLILGLPVELVGAAIFGLASLTDWLDGYLARRRGQVTPLGQILDPVADKLLISATLVSLVSIDLAPAWMVVVIIGRELAITGLRNVAYSRGLMMPASPLGKLKMVSQVIAILLLILGWERMPLLLIAGQAMLWVVLGTALISAFDYYRRFNRAMSHATKLADFSQAKARAEERKRAG
ncbi:MAG TPA: CDP-diacylglycerol--glycerol-3-phosphate 3-phosphatidyltransferase [Vicinamibacterales bacterium]|nr:CDP-diacylglycerol--glycerol-3-phosphate 3-phosphatidyltransferase [Vicinamibacterales bacterium]